MANECCEAMREAVAKACDAVCSEVSREARKTNPYSEGFSDGADECASRIRALPLPPSPVKESRDAPQTASDNGFVVGNGDKQTKWMYWDQIGPVWKADPWTALRFARREDAEAFAAENEDAWRILPLADALAEQSTLHQGGKGK